MAKKIISYLFCVVLGLIVALNYVLFVFPNSFAPAGLNGILTMIQYLTGFKLSQASLLLNIPLAIWVYCSVSRAYASRAMVFLVSMSGFLMVLEGMDLSAFQYSTTVSTLLGPAVAGLISGTCGYYMHLMGSCLGGTEFIAKLVHKRKPSFNLFTIVFALNVVVALASYFVYDYKIEPVLMSIIYSFMSSSIRDNLNRKHQSALRCEIITEHGAALGGEIIETLHHTVTALSGRGLYSGKEKSVLVCVVNPSQLPELTKLVAKYPGSFVTVSQVSGVMGNFKRLDSHSNPEKALLDPGVK